MDMRARVVRMRRSKKVRMAAFVPPVDKDDGKRRLKVARETRDYAEAIIETVRDPLLVLTADLRIEAANRSFYEQFHVTKKGTVGHRLYELGNRQWDIPRLRQLLKNVQAKNTAFRDFLVEHKFPVIGHRSMLLNARRLHRDGKHAPLILLAIEEITAQKQLRTCPEIGLGAT